MKIYSTLGDTVLQDLIYVTADLMFFNCNSSKMCANRQFSIYLGYHFIKLTHAHAFMFPLMLLN